MTAGPPGSFGAQLKALREAAGYTQEELATIAGLSVHGISALERGERRRPHVETVRALSAALDLTGTVRDALLRSARAPAGTAAVDELSGAALPLPPTALLGRDADLHTLRQWLADAAVRLVTLTGPGGAGKTRLALELAGAIAADGAARVVFVALAAVRNPAFVASSIAEALGLSDVTAVELPRRARVACASQTTLLILDNFEQVLDAAPLVAELLASVASLRVLVTSRAPLHVRAEREYPVGPLALESELEEMSTADQARSPAVRLFVERVRNVQPEFRLTPENGPTVAAICRRLDALPLALELTAPWMKVMTADNLLWRLAQDTLPSTTGPRDLPERQRTMNATVAWSYQLLEAAEQRAFRRFGSLPGSFPIEAAAAVIAGHEHVPAASDAAMAAAAGLIEKSLLRRIDTDGSRPMYQMLETVRAYATLELSAAGERDEALDGLARYCRGEASLAAQGLVGLEQVTWLHRVREDLDSYRAALGWLIERGRSEDASAMAWQLLFFWMIRGHAAEGIRWYEHILSLPSVPRVAESQARAGAAVMWYTRGELDRARVEINRARELALGAGAVDIVPVADLLTGHLEHLTGNIEAARERFGDSINGFRRGASPWGVGNALSAMGWVALAAGEADEAERLVDEATAELRRAGPWFHALGQYVRAILAVRRGNADGAIAIVHESLMLIRQLHDKFAFVHVMVPLAAAATLKQDEAWAARILGARDAVAERTGATVVDNSATEILTMAEHQGRARLGSDRWDAAYAAGRRDSIDTLLKDIDVVSRREHLPTGRGRRGRPART